MISTPVDAAPNSATPILHEAFEGSFLLGGTLSDSMLGDPASSDYEIVSKHFNTLSPENCMKWGRMNPEPGVYNLELADAFVKYGAENNIALVGHTLFWHSQTPDWVFEDEKGEVISRDALLLRMRERATLMVNRWGEHIKYWDVVNESILDDGSWRKSKFQQIIGDDFTEQAFIIASEILPPHAKLLYNDYSMTNAGKRDSVIAMVHDFKAKGIRIDGIGMQGHLGMKYPNTKEFAATIEAYAATGVKVHITELDLDLLGRSRFFGANVDIEKLEASPDNNPYPDGVLPAAKERKFAARYEKFFKILLEQEDNIERVTFWGVTDRTTWLNNFPVRGRTNFALLFDRKSQAKPAFYRVVEAAKKHANK